MASLPPQTAEAPPAFRKNRHFQLILSGQAVSALGDAMTLTAMPLFVLTLTGSGAMMGVVGALQLLPDIILGLPAGALADRWDRRRMMLWSDTGRAVLTATIPIAHWIGWPTMLVILLVTVPINALRVLSDTGLSSALPGLVGREHLGRANSLMEATLSVPYIVGPALAGVLVGTVGADATIAIDAGSFALSAFALAMVRRELRAERPSLMPRVLVDIREGLAFLWRHPTLRTLVSYWSVMTAATAALIPSLGYYLTIDRELGPEVFGFVGSTWSIGYLLGSLLAGRFAGAKLGRLMLGCGAAIGVVLLAFALSVPAEAYLAFGACIGGALALQTVAYMTLRPSLTPDALLGRVGSTARTAAAALRPLGILGGGLVISAASGTAALIVMGLISLGASVLFSRSAVLREAGAPE